MNKKVFLYTNPHSQHSFFSALALTDIGDLVLLCPPLQLQLLSNKWRIRLPPFSTKIFVFLGQLICLLSFLLFKAKLLTETTYIKILTYITNMILFSYDGMIWVHYQDYIRITPAIRAKIKLDICELIINTSYQNDNYKSTKEAVQLADIVIYPSSNFASSFPSKTSNFFYAPYGGDKITYRNLDYINHNQYELREFSCRPLEIVARANSLRKGIDILIESLALLDTWLGNASICHLNIKICGAVDETLLNSLMNDAKSNLCRSNAVRISAMQYSQNDYINILQNADLFVMPSRLEGSSPAALEALWLGIPSILSKSCGIDQFKNDEHGILLESLTSLNLFTAMKSIIINPSILTKWHLNLRHDVNLYNWSSYFQAYKTILKGALS